MKKVFKVSVSKVYVMYLLLLTVFVIGTYSSYAYFTVSKEKKNAIKMVTGNLVGELKVDGEISDKLVVEANTSKSFTIELINKNDQSARFNFYYKGTLKEGVEVGYIQNDGYNTMPSETGVNLEANGTLGYYQKYRIKVKNNTSDNVTILLGYSVGLDYNDLSLPDDCYLFEEMKMNPNEPKLASNMIPVRYDGSNWVKADKSNWYNYETQEWANAVTVSSDVRDGYIKASAGTTISMDKIDTMWVWIPRYSYTIGSEDGTNYYGKKGVFLDTTPTQILPGEIDVEFVDKNTKDRGSAKYKVSDGVSGWYTPDAFTFGNEELEGVWIGKFEASNKEGRFDSNNSDDSNLTPIIKPKVTSWRWIRVSTLETVSMKMNQEENIYGFQKSEVDTHVAKGSEWALVAYLSQSKYGKLGNQNYTGENKEIYMNAHTGYRTGCSYGKPAYPTREGEEICSHDYDEIEDRGEGTGAAGAGASTTGNIYGIYDMNGGAWDYVMSNYSGYTGNTEDKNSGYNGLLTNGTEYDKGIPYPAEKYYDKYLNANINLASHALGEMAGWYKDNFIMVNSTNPWEIRGGYCLDTFVAGVFGLGAAGEAGNVSDHYSFRLALVNT